MKKPLKTPKVLWGLWISAHTLCRQRCLDRPQGISHNTLAPEVLSLSHLPFNCSSPALWTKLKKRWVFPPHTSCCWKPLSSPGKPLVLTRKTHSRRPLQESSSPPHSCDDHLHKVLTHAAHFSGICEQKLFQTVNPRLHHAAALQS